MKMKIAVVCALPLTILLLSVMDCGGEKETAVSDAVPAAAAAPVDGEIAAEGERLRGMATSAEEAALASLRAKEVESDSASDPLWVGFRKTFPYHIQEIALSKPHRDGSRTIIVSEPPPDTSIDDILAAVGPAVVSYCIRSHPVGNDGWFRDVVLRVAGSDEVLANAASSLTRTIFRTSYKSYVLPLPAQRTPRDAQLDLDVTTAEIESWLGDETFVPALGGNSATAEQIFAEAHSAVYFSSNPGLVAWWLPKGTVIDDLAVEARQFSLDSDLVVGAIRQESGVMIVARERQVPVQQLPPLRFETIRLLAAVSHDRDDELGQSYQRNAPFAGIMGDGRDWAPIYLSPELVDTEYGSLLNITDQLLKGWSEGGSVRYIRFDDYPRPSHFRFDSVLEHLGGGSVTYNWNTTGVGYVVPSEAAELFALNRTGALPVSYIPDGSSAEAEDVMTTEQDGYEYFAGLNDPNLVRVVQYAALYQIFSAFEVRGRRDALARNEFPDKELERLTEEMANEIASVTDAETIQSIAERIDSHLEYFGLMPDGPVQVMNVHRMLEDLRAGRKETSTEGGVGRGDVLSVFACMREMPKRYADEVGKLTEAWIHTPVVVMSWNAARRPITGGHNLRARTTKVIVTDQVPEGMPEYTPSGELRIHPRDAKRAPELVYLGAKTADRQPAAVAARLRAALTRPPSRAVPRPRAQALRLVTSKSPIGAAPKLAVRGATTNKARGWRAGGSDSPVDVAIEQGVFIERRADRSIRIVFDESRRQIEASTIEDATDAVVQILKRGGGGDRAIANIELRGFQNQEANGFLRATNNRLRSSEREISALVHEGRIDPILAREIRSRRYDFSKAIVSEGALQIINGVPQAKIVIEIPRLDVPGMARTEVKVALHPEMKPSLMRRLVTEIRTRIQRVISELGTQLDAFTFNLRISREIKALSRETGVPIDIVEQQFIDAAADIHFASLGALFEERPAA